MRLLQVLLLTVVCVCFTFGQTYTIGTFAGGAPRPAALSANSSIGSPVGVAVDAAGNVYFASYNCIFKLDRTGGLTRIAGNYTLGSSGDGGPATAAQLSLPGENAGIAVDASGNVYIPDTAEGIRKVSPTGIITSVAISSGKLRSPTHLAADGSGDLYVAESFGGLVDKVSSAGVVTTVAGGGLSSPANGGPATGVYLTGPSGLALDKAGNLYFADYNLIYKVSPDGSLTTVAGVHSSYYVPFSDSGDGGPATGAQVFGPCELAVDGAGNLYIGTAGLRVRRVSRDGIITTIAGNGDWGYSADGAAASSGTVAPHGLAVDTAGNLFIADFGSNRIRKVSPNGIIATAAGNGAYGYSGDGGPATSAELSLPGAMAVDQAGNLYVADIGNNRVRKISTDGTITTVAGNGNPGHSGDGGPATSAEIMPYSLALDNAGNLYLLDYHGLRKVSLDGMITTVPGTSVQPLPAGQTSSPGTAAPFYISLGQYKPSNGLAIDSAGNLYTEGTPAIGLDKISPDGTITELLSDHYYPGALALDSRGNLDWVSDYFDNIQVIASAGQSGTLPGYSSLQSTLGNGCNNPGLTNYYSSYQGAALAADTAGNLYASNGGSPIQRFLPNGMSYLIEAGNITINTLAVDAQGNIYAADTLNNVIRVLQPAPAIPSLTAVTNAASNLAGPIAPGEIVAIYGQGLGPTALFGCQDGAAGLIDTQLNGTQVLFNGIPSPLLYTSATQVAAVVPYAVSGNTAQVSVAYQGRPSAAASVPIASSAPGLFTWDGTGKGQAAAVNQDGSINSSAKPAKIGDIISLYATGEGQTSPSGLDGKLPSNPLPQPVLPVTVTIGGQTVKPQYAGGTPGYFAGLMQVNVQIPAGVAPGNAVPVALQAGSAMSPVGVTIAIAGN